MLPAHAVTTTGCGVTVSLTLVSPTGSNTSPGDDVNNFPDVVYPWEFTVAQAPNAPCNIFTAQVIEPESGANPPSELTLESDGTYTSELDGNSLGLGGKSGPLELRIVWQSQQISLFWNLV